MDFLELDDELDDTKSPSPCERRYSFEIDTEEVVEPDVEQFSAVSTPQTEGCSSEVRAEHDATPGNAGPRKKLSPSVYFCPTGLFVSGSEENEEMRVPAEAVESRKSFDSVSLENSRTSVRFDPSSLLEAVVITDNKTLSPITDDQTVRDSVDEQTNCKVSFGSELPSAVKSVHVAPIRAPRGILKYKNLLSNNEKTVALCLKLLCQPNVKDGEQPPEDALLSSAKQVFNNLCFDQFFREGECFSSLCNDHHHYRSRSFFHPCQLMWEACVYVICHASRPNLQIIENLVQYHTAKGNTNHAMVFAKCVCRLKDTDQLKLAHFIVYQLSDAVPARDVITVILMLTFPELSSPRYNELIKGLGVFEQNATHYRELMAFLNFRGHVIPARFVRKLMEDSIVYSCEDIVESVSGFFKRLNPSEKRELQKIVNDFEERFGVLTVSDLNRDWVGENNEPKAKRLKTAKKKVEFAAEPDICEFDVAGCPTEVHPEVDLTGGDFSDADYEDVAEECVRYFHDSPESQAEQLTRVFGGSCRPWILNGQCLDAGCNNAHDFNKDSLSWISSDDALAATDYIVTQSQTPSLGILKIFVEFFCESGDPVPVLSFRKCAARMSASDSVKLTESVISLLGKQIGVWKAIEKVLVPVWVDDLQDGFRFNERLLRYVMLEAIQRKTSVLRCVTRAIMSHMGKLQPVDRSMALILSLYTEKFVKPDTLLPLFQWSLPVHEIAPASFASCFKVALYQGLTNKHFLATAMMKQAVDGSLRDQAADVLYTFLLSSYYRARALTDLLENCKYSNAVKSVRDLIGSAALATAVRLYENDDFTGTAELFAVLKNFKLNIFELRPPSGSINESTLAAVYCHATLHTVNNDVIDVFLKLCVHPHLNAAECPPNLVKLTSKMFHVFTSADLVEETLKLYKGMVGRQKSLLRPFNIVNFVEPTLRSTFHRLHDATVRKESLRLYLDVVDSETPVAFHKLTHRSVFLLALEEIDDAGWKCEVRGHANIIHPHMKKMLLTCISEGAYFSMNAPDITIYSSMTFREIDVYVKWWFVMYARARKRQGFKSYNPITVKIVQDRIHDDSKLPVHPDLRNVDFTVADCAYRLAAVIKMASAEPTAIVAGTERGVFEIRPRTARALTQTAVNIMLQHGYLQAGGNRLCTFSLDKSDVKLADKL